MKELLKHHLYIIGFSLVIGFAFYLNCQTPPNLDEARAYVIAQNLSLFEVFSISKTEGHPFLWYYILKPITKLHYFYPYNLYSINIIIYIIALYLLYKYAPFSTYLKYTITLSLPFLKLYNSFARCYSLTLMLCFILMNLYPKRHKKTLSYLTLIILLANSSSVGFFAAFSLGLIFLYECLFIQQYKKQYQELTIIFLFGAIELLLLLIQFYGYNKQIPLITPAFQTLQQDINAAYHPLNIYILSLLYLTSILIFIKNKNFASVTFLTLSSFQLTILLTQIHHGGPHHYYFYYIYLICAYWLSPKKASLQTLPLFILSFALIFNTNMKYKHLDINYLKDLKNSALEINKLFTNTQQEIIILEDYNGNILQPYLSSNITLLNQTATPYTTLKGLNEFLYILYVPINTQDIIKKVQKNPHVLIYHTCGNNTLENNYLTFNLKHRLNETHCLYDINIK